MIDNDSRKQNKGFQVGETVVFRWTGMKFRGKITRLTKSKAVIRFKPFRVSDTMIEKYIAYQQIVPKRAKE